MKKRKDMKRYCLSVKDVIQIIMKCPNCGKTWDLTEKKGTFVDIDKDSRLLFCGECQVDLDMVKNKIKHHQLKLKLMGT